MKAWPWQLRYVVARVLVAVLLLAPVQGPATEAQRAPRYLGRVELRVQSVTAADGHYVYAYTIVNPAASRAGVAQFAIDLAAAPGTGHHALPATGAFIHWPSAPRTVPAADHVPVGAITPSRWEASLDVEARLKWYGVEGGEVVDDRIVRDDDSVAPRTSMSGFGVRSTYLPGIRRFWAEPNWLACCSEPSPDSEEGAHPDPSEFAAAGFTAAPMVPPSEMTVAVLIQQLRDSCRLAWISSNVCSALEPILQRAGSYAAEGSMTAAAAEVGRFSVGLDEARRRRRASAHPNAYWMLRTNALFLISQLRR